MKRKSKPFNLAERAKQLGMTPEQFQDQARKQYRALLGLGPELTPREIEEINKITSASTSTYDKKDPSGGWPFPLKDMYDAGLAGHAIGIARRNYISGAGCFGPAWKNAIEVAFTIRRAWTTSGIALPEVPLAEDPDWPTKAEFYRLEQWFLSAEINRAEALGKLKKPASITQTQDATGRSADESPWVDGATVAEDIITATVATEFFYVSRSTLKAAVKDGRLKDYRPRKKRGTKSPLLLSRNEVARHWTQRKK
jgi:hypothetical protein